MRHHRDARQRQWSTRRGQDVCTTSRVGRGEEEPSIVLGYDARTTSAGRAASDIAELKVGEVQAQAEGSRPLDPRLILSATDLGSVIELIEAIADRSHRDAEVEPQRLIGAEFQISAHACS